MPPIGPLPSHRSLRRRRLTAAFLFTFAVAISSSAASRVERLTAGPDVNFPRIQIVNPSDEAVTFSLGFNDQLFESKEALLKRVREGRMEACSRVPARDRMLLPCNAWANVTTSLFHWPELSDQFDAHGAAGRARLWVESPMLAINSFGFGTCGTFADVLAKIWQELGYATRRRALNGHTVSEVKVGARWVLFDADLRGYFPRRGQVLGVDDLAASPRVARRTRPFELPLRTDDYPRAGLYLYPALLAQSTGVSLEVTEVPSTADDWRELTFTLPPGGRLVFPEQSLDECLSPVLFDAAHGTPYVNPPHHYAVVEVPPGSVTTMKNGLYTARIAGDFCANVRYASSEATTRHFDQVNRFRHARRFAYAFDPVEAYSNVLIYYMINNRVTVELHNELRLHGEGVERLDVSVVPAAVANIPAAFDGSCVSRDVRTTLPVTAIRTSSNSTGDAVMAQSLIDRSLASGWISAYLDEQTPQQTVLDLGSTRTVAGVRWAPLDSYGMLAPLETHVETSIDGVSFRPAGRPSVERPATVAWVTTMFEPTEARYVRLTAVPPPHFIDPSKFQTSLAEIQVLPGPGAAEVQITDVPTR